MTPCSRGVKRSALVRQTGQAGKEGVVGGGCSGTAASCTTGQHPCGGRGGSSPCDKRRLEGASYVLRVIGETGRGCVSTATHRLVPVLASWERLCKLTHSQRRHLRSGRQGAGCSRCNQRRGACGAQGCARRAGWASQQGGECGVGGMGSEAPSSRAAAHPPPNQQAAMQGRTSPEFATAQQQGGKQTGTRH